MSEYNSDAFKWSIMDTVLGLASLGVGIFYGYANSKEIPLRKENLETALAFGPTIVQGGLGLLSGGIKGLMIGAELGLYAVRPEDNAIKQFAKGTRGAVLGTLTGGLIGGAIGGVKGGIGTLMGYLIGYTAGQIIK